MMKLMAFKSSFEDPYPMSRIDWLAAMVVFILPLIGIPLSGADIPRWGINTLLVLFLGSLICGFILAVIRCLPHWSLSYLGFGLTIFVFYGLLWGLWGLLFYQPWMGIFGPMDSWSYTVRILYEGATTAFLWFLVLLTAVLLINLFRHWAPIQALWQHIREDWTLLSFVVYGGLIVHIWLIFDEYHYEKLWRFSANASLAIGAWFYLRVREQNKRFLALIGGATVAMWIIAIGRWNLVPMQNWPVDLESERWFESIRTISSWMATIAALTTPMLLNWLPPTSSSTVEKEITST
jgi:hypothetical protein